MSGALGDAGADGDWVLVAVPPAAASGVVRPILNNAHEACRDGLTGRATKIQSMMAATDLPTPPRYGRSTASPTTGWRRCWPILKHGEHRRVESVCQRWRQIRAREYSRSRMKSLRAAHRSSAAFVARNPGAALPQQPGGVLDAI